jgi:hypothetical protein
MKMATFVMRIVKNVLTIEFGTTRDMLEALLGQHQESSWSCEFEQTAAGGEGDRLVGFGF